MCKQSKELTEFYKSSYEKDGRNRYCKGCCKVNRALETLRKRPSTRGTLEKNHIQRAKDQKLPWEPGITLEFVFKKALGICALCNKWTPASKASLDHIVPISRGGGHTADNVQLAHLKCNQSKGNR